MILKVLLALASLKGVQCLRVPFRQDPELGWAVDVGSAEADWVACRDSAVRSGGGADQRPLLSVIRAGALLSTVGWSPFTHRRIDSSSPLLVGDCVLEASVPGTILTSLLRNGTFSNSSSTATTAKSRRWGQGGNNDAFDPASEVYIDGNLSNIPDINATGEEVVVVVKVVCFCLYQRTIHL